MHIFIDWFGVRVYLPFFLLRRRKRQELVFFFTPFVSCVCNPIFQQMTINWAGLKEGKTCGTTIKEACPGCNVDCQYSEYGPCVPNECDGNKERFILLEAQGSGVVCDTDTLIQPCQCGPDCCEVSAIYLLWCISLSLVLQRNFL